MTTLVVTITALLIYVFRFVVTTLVVTITALLIYSTFRAVWIRGAGVKPLRGGVAPTPPVPNSCENRCMFLGL